MSAHTATEYGRIGDDMITRKLRKRVAALEADNAALRKLLREVAITGGGFCRVCRERVDVDGPHAADCRLGAALKEKE